MMIEREHRGFKYMSRDNKELKATVMRHKVRYLTMRGAV
jgi:hypothetical protein